MGADVFDQAKPTKHARPTAGNAALLGDVAVNLKALDELTDVGALGPGGLAQIGDGKTAQDAQALPDFIAQCLGYRASFFPFKVGLVVKKLTIAPILSGDGLKGV